MEENRNNINWFPGHMAKAMRKTEEDIKKCDGVIYVMDSRAPFACFNKKLMKIFEGKPVVFVLNKTDMVEGEDRKTLENTFKAMGRLVISTDGHDQKGCERLKKLCIQAVSEKIERAKAKGVVRIPRFMVAGIPNTGKSTIINTLAKSKKAVTGDKAGVTRSNSWIRVGDFDLMDTPGTMMPNMENQTYAKHLAYIGSINDDILDFEWLSLSLLEELKDRGKERIEKTYNIIVEEQDTPNALFEKICRKRGYLVKGGEINVERGSKAIIDDLRKLKIGKICFELGEGEMI